MAVPGNLIASGYSAYKADHLQVSRGGFASRSLINVPEKPFASFPTLAANATAADIAKALCSSRSAPYLGADLAT
jgi:hypothetical protein